MSDAGSEATTKGKILDAAEMAFSEGGFDGASLRQIVAAAGVNLATVYYHFGSKEVLLEAVVERRLGPLKRAQLGCLRETREKFGRPLEVEAILHLLLSGPLALALPGSVGKPNGHAAFGADDCRSQSQNSGVDVCDARRYAPSLFRGV